jgi:succinylglutamate desuccinylase
MLQEFEKLPPGLLDADSHQLAHLLKAPSLIHLKGEREPALFLSVLMHGNETVGWDAARKLLRRCVGLYGGLELPRSLSLFIGNVQAAAAGKRHLPEQPDYNRIWPGGDAPPSAEGAMMQQVVDIMDRRGVFASVDLHNNTGCNPHYACVNALDNRFLHLATLFSRTVVYFLRPKGVQSMAMAELCPAVTLECGKVGDRHGVDHALAYLDACLRLSQHPTHPVAPHDIDLFHTVAQVKVPASVSFDFNGADRDILFAPDLDLLNFRELPGGTVLGSVRSADDAYLEVRDEQGRDVAHRYFRIEDNQLCLKVRAMPSMLTKDENVIRQDCLCYLMERYNDHVPHP